MGHITCIFITLHVRETHLYTEGVE
jgi:hypothetical protein